MEIMTKIIQMMSIYTILLTSINFRNDNSRGESDNDLDGSDDLN